MAVGYGPLSGVTVVDLTQFLSGPLATMIMADLGADVIKVERPDRPKASGPFLNGERVYDLSVQRSKKSITLNLKAETDKKVLLELVKKRTFWWKISNPARWSAWAWVMISLPQPIPGSFIWRSPALAIRGHTVPEARWI